MSVIFFGVSLHCIIFSLFAAGISSFTFAEYTVGRLEVFQGNIPELQTSWRDPD